MALLVEKVLKEKHINYHLITLTEKAYTVDDVVKYSTGNVIPADICKTIILSGKKTGEQFAIFLRGDDKIHFSIAKKYFGQEMTIASKDEVMKAAGVEPGAVCPFLLNVPLTVDKKVTELINIHCGSGDHLYGLEFKLRDLAKVVNYQVAELAKIAES
jgi:prolyl-tRNA editing enzyme YbaK/EbsC (Cys-tRNA(Pro) deacylase)